VQQNSFRKQLFTPSLPFLASHAFWGIGLFSSTFSDKDLASTLASTKYKDMLADTQGLILLETSVANLVSKSWALETSTFSRNDLANGDYLSIKLQEVAAKLLDAPQRYRY
jgi:hypothetical protein